MLRDPLSVNKCFADHFWSKNPNLQKPEKPLEPLDLLATVGQSCVCVNVGVLFSVRVCVCVKNNVVVLWRWSLRPFDTLSGAQVKISFPTYKQQNIHQKQLPSPARVDISTIDGFD